MTAATGSGVRRTPADAGVAVLFVRRIAVLADDERLGFGESPAEQLRRVWPAGAVADGLECAADAAAGPSALFGHGGVC